MNKPDFVNDEGVKWFFCPLTTSYAESKGLGTAVGYVVELPEGQKTRVLILDGKVVAEDHTVEGMGTKIDILSAHFNFEGGPP